MRERASSWLVTTCTDGNVPPLRVFSRAFALAVPHDEARRIAPTSPHAQKRVLSIVHPLVHRVRRSRERGAPWLDVKRRILWLLAVQQREADSDDDAYQYFADLHKAGRLLPTSDDDLRDRVESADRLRRAIRADLERVLDAARRQHGEAISAPLASVVPVRAVVRKTAGLEDVWLAVATRDGEGQGVPRRLPDYVFATLEALTDSAEWEWRTDWPAAPLEWFEIARLGLRVVSP